MFISFSHSWKILNLCLIKKPTQVTEEKIEYNNKVLIIAKRNDRYCSSAVQNVASCFIFMCVCLFCGFADGISRRMVRAASRTSTRVVEFVGSEPAYDDSQFKPLPISKGKNNPQSLLYSSRKRRELKLYFNTFNFPYILKLALTI